MRWIFETWIELPLVLGIIGLIFSYLGFRRHRNLGFLLLGLLFLHPIYQEVVWWIYKYRFVQTEIAPGHWSAPTRSAAIEYPILMMALLFATMFFLRADGRGQQKVPLAG